MPAARVGDMHVCPMVTVLVPHVGGPILPPGGIPVLIGGLPAARITDLCICVGPPDLIVLGEFTVLIGGLPAARMLDMTAHGGMIVLGCFTVLIGASGGGGAAGGGGGGAGGGKTFPTAEAAAIAAMKEANPKSVAEGREYGGWVTKNSDGTFSYAPPVRGSKDGLDNMPDKGPNDVAWYHTHGKADPGYDNENFSGADGDKGYSKANNAVGYVATPSGAIKKYDPATDTVTTLPDTAPP